MQTGKAGLPLRTITTVMMALTGASLFIAFMLEDLSGLAPDQSAALSRMLVLRYILAMAIGGALAGWLLAGLFGRRGLRGWFLALLGGIVTALIAGLLGSAVGLLPDLLADGFSMGDLIAVAFGLLVFPLALAGQPLLLALWLILIGLTHLWARRARDLRRLS
ncbi:hypothetical protein [Rhodobacteraceae bacterium DSL-40]|uniref:hypothetical protein n=1 Tax=Amaricoccus sp. B4 TaxID=3368557 RepID=UPI000DAEF3E0